MDGYQLLDLIRSYTRLLRIPTLVVSAADEAAELSIPYAASLRKPVDGPTVVEAVTRLVTARAKELR